MKKHTLKLTALLLLPFGLGASPAIAGTATAATQGALQEEFTLQFYPPDEGLPHDTTGGASRDGGNCAVDPNTLEAGVTLLAPAEYLGLTASARPEFLVNLDNTQAQRLFLSVQDTETGAQYQAYYPLPSQSGLAHLPLPEAAPDLEVGQTYRWSLAIVCGQRLRPDDPVLTSYVKRVEVSPEVAQLPALEQVVAYAESGIWYDSLLLLNQVRQADQSSDALARAWESLLVAGGLSDINPDVTNP
ncbi:MAG: DUF928 domain-containing protein [Leptolyngbya sp. RL_3_1]|nr:DUF928 domain-containing protein [Leptolyngbya sp. RL_3_1]